MRQVFKRAITAAVIVVMLGAVWTAELRGGAHADGIRLIDVEPFVFIETKLSGEQIRHDAYQARLAADPALSMADLDTYAERLFTDQLREKAERDGKAQVWITFYLGHAVVNGEDRVKTFRTIFVHDATGWRRVTPSSWKQAMVQRANRA